MAKQPEFKVPSGSKAWDLHRGVSPGARPAGPQHAKTKKKKGVKNTLDLQKVSNIVRGIHMSLDAHHACALLKAQSTKVESKDGKTPIKYIHDQDLVNNLRGMMDASQTYRFRIWAAPANASVSSNIIAGAFQATPLALPEFAGILSVLFDEYRVDTMHCHIRPVAVGGSTSGYDKNAYAICNDYLAATVPTTWEVCLARAESELVPVCAASGSGFYAFETQPQGSGVGKKAWCFKPPRELALSGSLGSLGPYTDVASNWPGAVLVYAETTATNGTVVMTCWREFHLSFRMRR